MVAAALGAEIEVPTLEGMVKLKIPAGTQHGKIFRLAGKGVPDLRRTSSNGDQYVVMQIEIPTKLTKKQKKLLEQMREDEPAEEHESLVTQFANKVRELMS